MYVRCMNVKNVKKKSNVLKDMKIHIEKDHDKCGNIFHLKINRIYKKKVDCKRYSYTDV